MKQFTWLILSSIFLNLDCSLKLLMNEWHVLNVEWSNVFPYSLWIMNALIKKFCSSWSPYTFETIVYTFSWFVMCNDAVTQDGDHKLVLYTNCFHAMCSRMHNEELYGINLLSKMWLVTVIYDYGCGPWSQPPVTTTEPLITSFCDHISGSSLSVRPKMKLYA